MTTHRKKFLYFVLITILTLQIIFSCTDSGMDPKEKLVGGLTGIVYDSTGLPISDANIYCLYYLNYIPAEPIVISSLLSQNLGQDSLTFELMQNFPNPFSNSSFFRFSLPEDCSIEFSVSSETTKESWILYDDDYYYGLYQLFSPNLVDSLSLVNGLYTYSLKANATGGHIYEAKKKFLIVSDLGKPNAKTDRNGVYSFNHKYTFVGDTIYRTFQNPTPTLLPHILNNHLNFLVTKDGYEGKYIEADLFPDIILNYDIVLNKE
jgi:hypothetical protein